MTEYKQLMQDVKDKKANGCTCTGKSGKLIPDPPCHVFFKPVTDAEKTRIEDDWGQSPATGVPSERAKYQKKMRIPSERTAEKTWDCLRIAVPVREYLVR